MTRRTWIAIATVAAGLVTGAVIVWAGLRWWAAPSAPAPAAEASAPPSEAVRKITATLYYISADGLHLVGVQREVPYAAATVEQARSIVEEQLKPAAEPLGSALPAGVTLRALYLTEHHEAFVDLSTEVTAAHSGGSLDELFTVYSIVNALMQNVPAITGVQLLVDGKEVDTLAGHVDLRRPLQKNLKWVETPQL